ncbi:hypothetical protein D3C80_1514840 [compost metagenome]
MANIVNQGIGAGVANIRIGFQIAITVKGRAGRQRLGDAELQVVQRRMTAGFSQFVGLGIPVSVEMGAGEQ